MQRASGVPHALYRAEDFMQGLGRFAPRGRERVFSVIASQRVARTRAPLARNDGKSKRSFATSRRDAPELCMKLSPP